MIGDPGSGANRLPEPEAPVKVDRIPYEALVASSGPAPLAQSSPSPMDIDPETPLDMTVRRKNSSSSDRQPPSIGAAPLAVAAMPPNVATSTVPLAAGSPDSQDAAGGLNMRPSVITKAPPPPIKKRISSMHSNGEIVIKSSVGDNLSPVNCDVFIEEHFRRSLGNTYASIYGTNNNNNNNQQKSSGSDTRNSSTSSSSSISSSSSSSSTNSSGSGLSCAGSLSNTSGVSSASSSASNLLGPALNFSFSGHPIGALNPVPPRPNHAIPPLEIPPLIKVKLEPGVLGQHTPAPQQPPLIPQPQLIRPEVKIKVEPGTVLHVRPDSEEEVDDHFAKALGNDTWKMIQEKNMNL
ncbi:uncharacterized protein DDB_G0271670-like [Uranotaenia lowii]|uniref:uncharacterized protein DDB_G0271670-like n=1 Tax=Uranotaenia lowii TaxID=190385 RepID=UPI002479327E|nr:uncharacterized protein DDB_G0271670-like [Uranotaenia lowii]XP_055600942.1 uncharacterized protein DDB_G0271670-like [Uranotaenia lowii]